MGGANSFIALFYTFYIVEVENILSRSCAKSVIVTNTHCSCSIQCSNTISINYVKTRTFLTVSEIGHNGLQFSFQMKVLETNTQCVRVKMYLKVL